jgi:hypothetical protein
MLTGAVGYLTFRVEMGGGEKKGVMIQVKGVEGGESSTESAAQSSYDTRGAVSGLPKKILFNGTHEAKACREIGGAHSARKRRRAFHLDGTRVSIRDSVESRDMSMGRRERRAGLATSRNPLLAIERPRPRNSKVLKSRRCQK